MNAQLKIVLCLSLLVPTGGSGQQTKPVSKSDQRALGAAAAGEPRLRQKPWLDAALRQFNPDDLDYGAWLEQRRHEFRRTMLANPYFLYGFWTTIACTLMLLLCGKLWTDNRRILRVTAEMMADLYKQDILSHQAATEAIAKYNQHIEVCNRAIEMETSGDHSRGFTLSPTAEAEITRLSSELARAQAEVKRLELENLSKARTLADLSMRIDGGIPANRQTEGGPRLPDLSQAEPELVTHINTLQEKLYASQKENRRLKGA